ncbi:MAG: carbohydrate ABC transporter permease [Clostridia bacterium]|nr:carbohydrate ABC transporter permease [Clostridia bacterium]
MSAKSSAGRKNRAALLICAAAALAIAVLMCLPLVRFTTSVYTKRSANTFVGDEKYEAALAEAQAAKAEFEADGSEVTIEESVTERVNSKGETTSMVAFEVRQTVKRSGWDFLAAGFAPATVMRVLVLAVALSLVLALLGLRGTMDTLHRDLSGAAVNLRAAACVCGAAAILMAPVFSMVSTYTFSRQVGLIIGGNAVSGADALLERMDAFLYGGTAGERITDLLGGLSEQVTPVLLLMLLALCVLLGGLIVIWRGGLAKTLSRAGLYLFVIVVSVLILYPFYVMLITAFRSNAETTDMYFLHMLPTRWIWSNLKDIVDRGVLRFLLNSIMLSTGATVIAMLCGIPAAYAMARMNFKGKKIFLGFVIMSQMFSPVVLLVGISQLMNTLHLNDTIIGLMLINAAFNQAFAIWLLRGTFVSISPEMEQAACIDGCSTVGALVNILLPMAAPGIVTTLIFVFINSWNEYTISTVLISTPTNKPITVGITQFSSFNMIEWQYLFAAALLATIPVVILFMCIEKHLAAGLTSGGVKG